MYRSFKYQLNAQKANYESFWFPTGNGGHIVFKASYNVNNLGLVATLIKADSGQSGRNKDRIGKSAEHKVIPVPVGTIVRAVNGKIVGDLDKDGSMFVAARGGAGTHIHRSVAFGNIFDNFNI